MRPLATTAHAVTRIATRVRGFLTAPPTEIRPYDIVTTGTPRRSCRVFASSERQAKIFGAVELRVDLERVQVRQTYSLVSRERA